MATRSTSRDHAAAHADESNSGATVAANAAVAQLAGAATAASALLRAAETLAQTQQHMIQRAASLQEQTADRLRHASSPLEVMSIQSSLFVSGWSEITQYTQEMMMTALKVQSDLVRPGDANSTGASAAASPLLQAWQAVFTTPMGMPATDTRH